jgi:diamine N-acetyltransferase
MDTNIRLATNEDAPNLAALSIQVWLHTYATSGIRTSLSEYVLSEFTVDKFTDIVADPDHILIIAEVEYHLVGYADLKLNSPCKDIRNTTTELATLYVQEHFAGRGIGSQLFNACHLRAQQFTGESDFWLSVYHLNQRAISFYQKHGLSIQGSFFFEFGRESHKNYILGSAQV